MKTKTKEERMASPNTTYKQEILKPEPKHSKSKESKHQNKKNTSRKHTKGE